MSLINVFSDPKLRARQDQLDAQWKSLRAVYQMCDQTPDSAFAEFSTDFRAWSEFYDSGSDWSSDSNNATNVWQSKAKEWADKLTGWGCYGNFDSSGVTNSGVPGVKNPPPDEKSILESVTDSVSSAGSDFFGTLSTIGWVAVVLFVLILGMVVYVLTHAKASTPYGNIG